MFECPLAEIFEAGRSGPPVPIVSPWFLPFRGPMSWHEDLCPAISSRAQYWVVLIPPFPLCSSSRRRPDLVIRTLTDPSPPQSSLHSATPRKIRLHQSSCWSLLVLPYQSERLPKHKVSYPLDHNPPLWKRKYCPLSSFLLRTPAACLAKEITTSDCPLVNPRTISG